MIDVSISKFLDALRLETESKLVRNLKESGSAERKRRENSSLQDLCFLCLEERNCDNSEYQVWEFWLIMRFREFVTCLSSANDGHLDTRECNHYWKWKIWEFYIWTQESAITSENSKCLSSGTGNCGDEICRHSEIWKSWELCPICEIRRSGHKTVWSLRTLISKSGNYGETRAWKVGGQAVDTQKESSLWRTEWTVLETSKSWEI